MSRSQDKVWGWGTPYWFNRLGGKQYLKKKIGPLIPKDIQTYVEPFVGSGKVLLSLDPFPKEVVNDLDKNTYYLWKDMKSVKPSFIASMDLTPSKTKFDQLKNSKPSTIPQRLYKNLYINANSFSSMNKSFVDKGDGPGNFQKKLVKNLPEIQERLKGITITNKDWKSVVKQYDGKDSFFYLDPSYYEVEGYGLPDVTPEDLWDVLSKTKGRWLLSYNDVPIIRKLFHAFNIRQLSTHHRDAEGGRKPVKEVVISNYTI